MAAPLWQCSDAKTTHINAFRLHVNRNFALNLASFNDLQAWCVENVASFARTMWEFAGIKYHTPPTRTADGLDRMYPPPTWFPGATLNYTENLLSLGLSSTPDAVAVTACQENSTQVEHLTWIELERRTAVWAHALRQLGVGLGDAVAVILPNKLDCLLALLATASIGAIFSSTSPDMGAKSIIERYGQLKPKVLIVDTLIQYSGRKINICPKLREALQALTKLVPDLKHTIVVNGPPFDAPNVRLAKNILNPTKTTMVYEALPFDHPLYVLYSSGTTGPPKCIVHAAGRALLQQKKELLLHMNLGQYSTHYQYTTTGWMMWNHMVAALSVGARIVLFDGSPLHPQASSQLDLIRQQAVTSWGTSPKFLDALKKQGLPRDLHLDSLVAVQTGGSPLSAKAHQWFQHAFGPNIGLFSCSGGTDLVGGIVGGNPALDLYAGEISGPFIGMKVEIWDSTGTDISNSGEAGDLVITQPFFSMPLTFLGEDGEERYRNTYFSQYPGVWYHGDFIRKIKRTGGYEILGRSDGILNPGGVRFGSAEIYGVLDHFPELEDYICVGQKLLEKADEKVLLFLKVSGGNTLNASLITKIQNAIRTSLSARHVPTSIHQVNDIPYTVNGKRIENLVRDVVNGKIVTARTAINPECLDEYRNFVLPTARASKM